MDAILTTRFRLLPLIASHADELFAALSSPDVYRYIPVEAPTNVAALADRYRHLESRRSADGMEVWLNWAICVPSDDRLVGIVEATVYADGKASIARQIEATVDVQNQRSIRLLERLGFVRIATRDSKDLIGGAPSIEHVYVRAKEPNQPLQPTGASARG
jgi:RimJ/RimL family protein N-acetyltransferase